MSFILFRGFGDTTRGRLLWHVICLALLWKVLGEWNAGVFEDKWWFVESVCDLIHFYSSF